LSASASSLFATARAAAAAWRAAPDPASDSALHCTLVDGAGAAAAASTVAAAFIFAIDRRRSVGLIRFSFAASAAKKAATSAAAASSSAVVASSSAVFDGAGALAVASPAAAAEVVVRPPTRDDRRRCSAICVWRAAAWSGAMPITSTSSPRVCPCKLAGSNSPALSSFDTYCARPSGSRYDRDDLRANVRALSTATALTAAAVVSFVESESCMLLKSAVASDTPSSRPCSRA
jgi:hypothetical protein